jgi:hypothetical protein
MTEKMFQEVHDVTRKTHVCAHVPISPSLIFTDVEVGPKPLALVALNAALTLF